MHRTHLLFLSLLVALAAVVTAPPLPLPLGRWAVADPTSLAEPQHVALFAADIGHPGQ